MVTKLDHFALLLIRYGSGRKAQKAFLSPVLLAVYDEEDDVFRSISRCMTFTDAMYDEERVRLAVVRPLEQLHEWLPFVQLLKCRCLERKRSERRKILAGTEAQARGYRLQARSKLRH